MKYSTNNFTDLHRVLNRSAILIKETQVDKIFIFDMDALNILLFSFTQLISSHACIWLLVNCKLLSLFFYEISQSMLFMNFTGVLRANAFSRMAELVEF